MTQDQQQQPLQHLVKQVQVQEHGVQHIYSSTKPISIN